MQEPLIVVSAFPERRESLEFDLEKQGHSVSKYIDAPRGSEVLSTHPQYRACHRWFDPIEKRPLTFGELACYAGHRAAWQEVVDRGEPCIVLEDDARLNAPLDKYGFKGEVCYLGGLEMAEPKMHMHEGWKSADYVYHCSAIRYTPEAAQKLLNATNNRPVIPVDEILPWHVAFNGNPNVNPKLHGVSDMLRIDAWRVPEWIVTQSQDFRGTETGDCAVELVTLIPATDKERASETFEAFKDSGYFPQIVGSGQESWDRTKEGGSPKLEWLRDELKAIPDDSWVLYSDGYDTLPVFNATEVVSRAIQMDADIIIGGEVNHWPENETLKAQLDAKHGDKAATHKYPNSGVIVGDSKALKAILADQEFGSDDQAWWQEKYVSVSNIRVDCESYISLQACNATFQRRNGLPFDAANRCFPAIVHGNGNVNMDRIRPLQKFVSDTEEGIFHPKAGEWLEVANGIVAMPFFQESLCRAIVDRGMQVPSLWQALENDPVPGDELRINVLDNALHEEIEAGLEKFVAPFINQRWHPATWSNLKDLFLIRYSKERQGSIGLHNDQSRFSCSIVLQRACCGGELIFPRQNFRDVDVGVGWLLCWPAPITHPHMVNPVIRGKRVSMVVWTQE